MRLYFLPSLLKPLALLALLGCGVLPLQTQPGRVEPLAVNLNKVPKDHGPLKRIVVERFEDESALQDPESVERTRAAFVGALHASQRVVLVSPDEIKAQTRSERLAEAKAKGISALVYGKVKDITTRQAGDPVGIVRTVKMSTTATVELVALSTSGAELYNRTETARIDSQSTRVAERAHSSRYASHSPQMSHQALRTGFSHLLEGLLLSLQKVQWRGRIALIEGDRIFVNAGKLSGLQPGDILRVSDRGREIYDPETGQMLGESPGRVKGTLEVISFFGQDGTVTLIHSGSGFTENDIVELY